MHNSFPDAGAVELLGKEDQYQGLDARIAGRAGRIQMARATGRQPGIGSVAVDDQAIHKVAHVQQHISPLGQPGQALGRRRVTAEDKAVRAGIQPVGQ